MNGCLCHFGLRFANHRSVLQWAKNSFDLNNLGDLHSVSANYDVYLIVCVAMKLCYALTELTFEYVLTKKSTIYQSKLFLHPCCSNQMTCDITGACSSGKEKGDYCKQNTVRINITKCFSNTFNSRHFEAL